MVTGLLVASVLRAGSCEVVEVESLGVPVPSDGAFVRVHDVGADRRDDAGWGAQRRPAIGERVPEGLQLGPVERLGAEDFADHGDVAVTPGPEKLIYPVAFSSLR